MQFGSDNQTGASDQVLQAIINANIGNSLGYGDDYWTQQSISLLRELFECPHAEVFLVSTGTASNCLALSCLVKPWELILCHQQSHLLMNESTAAEFFTHGARPTPVSNNEGKVTAKQISNYFECNAFQSPHHSIPAALSISQASENGLVYTPHEISEIGDVSRENNLSFHMDGARFANAIASAGCTPAQMTWLAGVDVLSLGATKSGALSAEAVIFFKPELAKPFIHLCKKSGHMLSKGRLAGSQFIGWLTNDHWLNVSKHANQQAKLLAHALSLIDEVDMSWPVASNIVFMIVQRKLANHLIASGASFTEWAHTSLPEGVQLNDDEVYLRLVTSFKTTSDDITDFCSLIQMFYSNTN